jgi:hypothetical protein
MELAVKPENVGHRGQEKYMERDAAVLRGILEPVRSKTEVS